MKQALLFVLLVMLVITAASTQETVDKPTFGIHMVILGSWAPIGFGAEYFVGPVGFGAQLTMLPLGSNGNYLFLYEPAVGIRGYFSRNTDNSFYAGFSTHYSGAIGSTEGSFQNIDLNVIRFNGLVGFNALIGENNTGRLAVEIGPRFNVATDTTTSDRASWFLVHFQLILGRVW